MITIDDEVVWDNYHDDLYFSNPNSFHPSLWGPLLEKAWSKIQFNYENSDGGFQFYVMKALLGCPVKFYPMKSLKYASPLRIWTIINVQQTEHNYPFVASTPSLGAGGDTEITDCGLTAQHAYPILSSFALKNHWGNDVYYLYMMRDPNGIDQLTEPTFKWNVKDRVSWKKSYRE